MKNIGMVFSGNYRKARKDMKKGNPIIIHKEVGKVRKNCVYAQSSADIPSCLKMDGSVVINGNTIVLHAVEGPAIRTFPVYVCWEDVSEENREKVNGRQYGAWPKDNGAETLKVVDGKCYNLPAPVKAVFMTEELPQFVVEAGFPVVRNGNNWELTRTDWDGEVRIGTIGKALWCEYGPGDVNILAIAEESAAEYIVSADGKDVCRLTDLF